MTNLRQHPQQITHQQSFLLSLMVLTVFLPPPPAAVPIFPNAVFFIQLFRQQWGYHRSGRLAHIPPSAAIKPPHPPPSPPPLCRSLLSPFTRQSSPFPVTQFSYPSLLYPSLLYPLSSTYLDHSCPNDDHLTHSHSHSFHLSPRVSMFCRSVSVCLCVSFHLSTIK